jgi:hypothetical protein
MVESNNLGIFFLELFTQINEWSKVEVWDKECEGYLGFAKVIGKEPAIKLEEFQSIKESIQKRFAQNIAFCLESQQRLAQNIAYCLESNLSMRA